MNGRAKIESSFYRETWSLREKMKALESFGPFGDWTEEDFARMETSGNKAAFERLLDKKRGNS